MWSLLGVEQAIGMELTESMAMLPAAAVSAVVFANPCAQYFAVGKITADQVCDVITTLHELFPSDSIFREGFRRWPPP